jgi:hypothetical protein
MNIIIGTLAVLYLFGVAVVCKILDHCGRETPKPPSTDKRTIQ